MTSWVVPHGGAAKSGTGMIEIMPVPRNLCLLSYQQGALAALFFICLLSDKPPAPALYPQWLLHRLHAWQPHRHSPS